MVARVVRRLLAVGVLLILPALAPRRKPHSGGTVVDATGGVLPGATLTAVLEASGNTFEGVTDERGVYRIAARAGVYRLTVAMPRFGNINRQGIELLVGQQVVVNVEMSPRRCRNRSPSRRRPLLDLTSSSLGGNVDPRQTQELPVNGRDWMALTLAAPGMRANATDLGPTSGERMGNREFQLNIDGQEVSVAQGGNRGQPRFSRDAIGGVPVPLEPLRRDAGRSTGLRSTPSPSRAPTWRPDRSPAISATTTSTRPTSSRAASCRIRISSSARRMAGRSCGTGCTTSPTTNTSASRGRRPSTLPIPVSTSSSPARVNGHGGAARRLSVLAAPRLMTAGTCSLPRTRMTSSRPAADRRSPGRRGKLQAAQRGALRDADAGPHRPDAERGQSGLQQPLLPHRQLHGAVRIIRRRPRASRSVTLASRSRASRSAATSGRRRTAARTSTSFATT